MQGSLPLLVSLLLVSTGCTVDFRHSDPLTAFQPITLAGPGDGLGPEDMIDGVDVVVADGRIHLAWREVDRDRGGGIPRYRSMYGSLDAGDLNEPVEVTPLPVEDPPRLAWGDGSLQLVAGPRLLHSWLSGSQWRPPTPLLGEDDPEAQVSLPITMESRLEVLFVATMPTGGTGLYRVRPGAEPRLLAEQPPSRLVQPAPAARVEGDRLDVLWAVNLDRRREVRRGNKVTEVLSTGSRLLLLRTGKTEADRPEPTLLGDSMTDPLSTVTDVALIEVDGGGLQAFAAAPGLYSCRTDDGQRWTALHPLARPTVPPAGGGSTAHSLSAAAGHLAWIDDRFQDSDRSPLRPLGGWPWSDDPDWADNDLLLLRPDQLAGPTPGRGVAPVRLTADHTFARQVRLVPVDRRLLVVWAGRDPVGKDLDSAGAPPRIRVAFLPQHSPGR